mmetsp:Transcript_57105/g.121360  ORF Transcript_57105/g.121360 Transcript_57105/m.121360 type:complete len:264 (-) Transcript_57105:221-1012(-)|eukprot:CAMPEP_0206475208 /NCGR_PEP_ID=MMETSP0324_2-20121206/33941_1 /ASSEMBLY_ACC=CAM_ASM_000836 /TAXON_ID=2866 /ORGANISM="Crypthecodinium cohnii, Strain Seligo" /LENGTH=263 /DNA_ID=CAMNT_0053950519 /DNA_START=104 /DNA_END=895 /DNA_ORIENTATION=+
MHRATLVLGLEEVASCLASSDFPHVLAVDRELSHCPAYVQVKENGERLLRLRGCTLWGGKGGNAKFRQVHRPSLRKLRMFGSHHQLRHLTESLELDSAPLPLRTLVLIGPCDNRKVLADSLIWKLAGALPTALPQLHTLAVTDLNLSRSGGAALGGLIAGASKLERVDLHGLQLSKYGWHEFLRRLSERPSVYPKLVLSFQDKNDTFGSGMDHLDQNADQEPTTGLPCEVHYKSRLGPFKDVEAAQRVLQGSPLFTHDPSLCH